MNKRLCIRGVTFAVAICLVAACSKESSQPEAVDTTLTEPERPVIPSPVVEYNLDDTLVFASPSECISGGTLSAVYDKLDAAMNNGASGATVKLDAFPNGLPVKAGSTTDNDGVLSAHAEIRFPAETKWNGLALSRIGTARYSPPESDSSYSRIITFLEKPEVVQTRLSALGFSAPLDPEYATLPDTYNSCGGSMYVETISGGSALHCGWGC
ncbi:hypothetical protein [Sphingomonas colocasiae]|uniref:Lipoprotein n=1 Tax=Sphingomonas colocasiae TaxID=1848973 RepID=A0ABS7PR24_9SPHN|nr:hypothetical protein [Sphingomonas colocasiae]MBY8823793.1 hypothetical protein [Sphingomonas colocasiae]